MAKIAPEVGDTIKTPVEVDQAQQPEQPQTISGGHLVARALKAEGIEIHSYELKSVQVGELKKKARD